MVILAFPIIAVAIGAAALSSAGWNIYQTHQSTKKSDEIYEYSRNYQQAFYEENSRFWDDYIKRHHLEKRQIKYPYRTGYNFNRTGIMGADAGLYNDDLSRTGSYFRAGSTALGLAGLYRAPTTYRSNPNYTDMMYG